MRCRRHLFSGPASASVRASMAVLFKRTPFPAASIQCRLPYVQLLLLSRLRWWTPPSSLLLCPAAHSSGDRASEDLCENHH
ncbi:hypothetical protein ZWY2020_017062 [Hordeum vulgare]|nr:hypothetical protein ZWY2020_017062 [Hordeum vulgare]